MGFFGVIPLNHHLWKHTLLGLQSVPTVKHPRPKLGRFQPIFKGHSKLRRLSMAETKGKGKALTNRPPPHYHEVEKSNKRKARFLQEETIRGKDRDLPTTLTLTLAHSQPSSFPNQTNNACGV
ncbi:hypothetical protein V6N11_043287 [Hibiscus sabdariffa]|uniref:Uncharacterized protein n=1 Tax=Hibiscus sabdariffa TaxID=183260 RepID=A0ABR2QYR8_9ROSI